MTTDTVRQVRSRFDAARLAHLAPHAPAIALLAGLAVLLFTAGGSTIVQVSWLAVVAGREIVQSGLPSVDHLTVLGAGHRWIDQQWLAHLAFYGLMTLGGMKAVSLVGAAAALLAYGILLAAANRERTASPTAITLVALLAGASAPWGFQVRAQELVLPLFATVLALLLADPAAERLRTLVVLPLLCLWANLHGSAVIGAAVVSLYGLAVLAGSRFRRRAARRAAPFVLVPPLTLIVSPYGVSLIRYYRLLLVDPPFRNLVQEWQAPRPAAYTAPFFVLAAVAVALLVFRFRRFRPFEAVLLLVTVALALDAIRNTVWFALAALAVLPARVFPVRAPRPSAAGGALAVVAAAGLLAVCGVAVAASPSHYEGPLGRPAARAVAAAAGRAAGPIYADDAHADWVLWNVRAARGRVLYDSRLELLDRPEIQRIADLQDLRGPWERTLAGVNVLVVEPELAARFVRARWGRVVYADAGTAVLLRGPA